MVAVKHRLAGVALVAFACGALANDARPAAGASNAHAAHMAMDAAASGATQKAPLATGAAFDARHRLWVAWVEGLHVVVAHSDDAGHTLSAPVAVNALPEPIYTSAENRPKIAASPDGRAIYVTWSMPLDAPYTGMVRFSRSIDGGATWTVPVTVHRDRQAITHRFDMLTIDPRGRIFVAWIDKRDLVAAQRAGRSYDGAAIYYAVSDDGGATFEPERKVADHTCECCRIAMTIDPDGRVQATWRNVFPGQIRDHAVAVLPASAGRAVEPVRATFSNWHVEACPDHGPALAITTDGVRHLAWFGVVDGKADVFYSRLDANGKPLGTPFAFGDDPAAPGEQASHAALVAQRDALWLAWKAFDGDTMRIKLRRSDDGGAHWSAPRTLAQTSGASDNPQLLTDSGRVYLSWRTRNDGYRLIDVGALQ
ncbi:BNR repeat-like domain protein [Burkholderia thailandensis USAMRU Malaysia |nr:BNR repeat-like domain protein [Burkholderia thailandensis E444]AIC88653.1 BNR repeat-like domain protein [Burkholderia thailandensis USAMRU Malaysia \